MSMIPKPYPFTSGTSRGSRSTRVVILQSAQALTIMSVLLRLPPSDVVLMLPFVDGKVIPVFVEPLPLKLTGDSPMGIVKFAGCDSVYGKVKFLYFSKLYPSPYPYFIYIKTKKIMNT